MPAKTGIVLLATLLSTDHGEADLVMIEVLYFDGCPNHEALLPRLRDLLARAGASTEVDLCRITDHARAQRERCAVPPAQSLDRRPFYTN